MILIDLLFTSGTVRVADADIYVNSEERLTDAHGAFITDSAGDYITSPAGADLYYKNVLINAPDINRKLPHDMSGIVSETNITLELSDNEDTIDTRFIDIVASEDIRGCVVKIYRLLEDENYTFFSCTGKITQYEVSGSFNITLSIFDDAELEFELPRHTTSADRFTTSLLDSGMPINICFGRCIDVPLYNIRNDRTNNIYDYLIGYGPIEGVWQDASTGKGIRREGVLVTTSEYTVYDGTQSTPYPGYAFIRFGVEQRDYSNSMMSLTGDIKGLILDGGSTTTRNFGLVMYYLLTNTTWGAGLTASRVSFENAADLLSTSYLCDGCIYDVRQVGDILNDMLFIVDAYLDTNVYNEYIITVNKAGSSVATFGNVDGYWNNSETRSVRNTNANELIKDITARYGHEPSGDGSFSAYEITHDVWSTKGKSVTYDLPFVEDDDTAVNVVSRLHNRSLLSDLFVETTISLEGKDLKKSDIITYIDPIHNINSDFVVTNIVTNNRDKFNLSLRKYDAAIFSTEIVTTPTKPIIQDTTVSGPKSMVGSLQLGDGAGNSGSITLTHASTHGDTAIMAGKTSPTEVSGTGFWVGLDDSDGGKAKLYLGSPSIYLYFDGTKIVFVTPKFSIDVSGNVTINDATLTVGDPTGDRVVVNADGITGYSELLGTTFNVPTDGTAPTFSSGIIQECVFQLYTAGVIKTAENPSATGGIIMTNNDFVAYKTDGSKMIDVDIAAGVCNINATVTIGAGSTGIGSFTDAGSLATRDSVVYYQTTDPYLTAITGDLWYNTDTKVLKRRDGSSWVTVGNAYQTYAQDAAPTTGIATGDYWIDTNDKNILYRYSGTVWVSVRDTDITAALEAASTAQSTADGKIESFYQDSAPTTGMSEGDIWFDTNDGNKIYIYESGFWVSRQDSEIAQALADASDAQATADGKVKTWFSTTTPTASAVGDLWYNTDNKLLKRWSGSAWVATSNAYQTYYGSKSTFTSSAVEGDYCVASDEGNKLYRFQSGAWVNVQDTSISDAFDAISDLEDVVDGKIVSYYLPSSTPPTTPSTGDLWFKTDLGNKIFRYSGSAWVSTVDSDIAQAISDASDAQATADSKVITFYTTSTPTAEAIGDLWYNTTTKLLKRWSGSAWVEVSNAYQTYAQNDPPTGVVAGDYWIDTNDNNILYRYSGSAWVSVRDLGIAAALSNAATAQSTADGKINSFYQTTAPSTGMYEGDIWFDTDDGNKIYIYEGSSWVNRQDSKIAQALSDASDAQATADGKVQTFFTTSTPTATATGDLWYSTATKLLKRWSGSAWEETANAYKTFYQTRASVTGMVAGDLCIDSGDGNKLYRYNGSAWVAVPDAAIATAQSLAASKTVTFQQTTTPTALAVGDMWWNPNTGLLKRWSGSTWETSSVDVMSSTDVTKIDGGKIYTGSITASVIGSTTLITNSANIGTGVITTAKIGDLQVDSAKIANLTIGTGKITNNAISESYANTITYTGSTMAGGAGTLDLFSTSFVMDYAGTILVWGAFTMDVYDYTSYLGAIKINSTYVYYTNRAGAMDYTIGAGMLPVALVGSAAVSAGTHTVKLQWTSDQADSFLTQSSIIIMGVYK